MVLKRTTGFFVVLTGLSGSGKTSVVRKVRARDPQLIYSVSATSRPPRPCEVDGEDYFFLSEEEFERRRDQGHFLEWAQVYESYYGTPKTWVLEQLADGKDVITELDVQGASAVKAALAESVTIFMVAPSRDTLEKRLRGRRTDDETTIARRLGEATRELATVGQFDYVVENGSLDEAADSVLTIIRAERSRVGRNRLEWEKS